MSKTDDTDDDEKYKALIRELHEATKDARTARREIQDERNRLIKDLQLAQEKIGHDFEGLAARVVEDYMAALNGALASHAQDINETVSSADDTIRRCAAELAGVKDADEFLTEIVSRLRSDITSALDSRFIEMAEEIRLGSAEAKPRRRRQGQRPKPPPVTQLHLDHPIGIRLPNGGFGK